MKIDNDQPPVVTNILPAVFRQQQPAVSFSSVLSAEELKAKNEAVRDGILASQKPAKENAHKDDLDYIREHGMRAYAEEVHKQKIEELREKLLEAMGLSEEALDEMPADQRMAIEEMISQEIQKRLAADSLTNGGSGPDGKDITSASVGDIDPGNLLGAQILAGDPGTLVGLVISEAAQDQSRLNEIKPGEDDG